MRHFLSVTFSSVLLALSFSSVTSFAGDCNKTVMGGGCTSEVGAGVSPHMHSPGQANAGANAKTGVAPAAKTAAPKNVKVSNSPSQKPQI